MDTPNQPQLPDNLIPQPETILLDPLAIEHLKQTRKWTNFLSVITFVMLGLMIVFVIVMVAMQVNTQGSLIGLVAFVPVAIMVVIYFFPIYYLYQFSKYAKHATLYYDGLVLTRALRYLQMHYRYMGILVIVLMGFYLLLGIGAVATGQLMHLFDRM